MEYNGQYVGVDKIIIADWNKKEKDFNNIYKTLTIDSDLISIKQELDMLKTEYPSVKFKVLKETWVDNSWSDYEEVKIPSK
jgi:hypothetical protein